MRVDTAWIFDVDGVITDPEKKEVTNPQLFDELIKRLKKGEPVALATGRALEWVIKKIVNPLESRIKENNSDISLLDNFYVSGEFGGSHLFYNKGKRELFVNK